MKIYNLIIAYNEDTDDLKIGTMQDNDFKEQIIIPRASSVIETRHIRPQANDTYDLGSLALKWNEIFANTISGSLIRSSGDVVAFYGSDERLKDNIKLIENPIEKVQQLRGIEYQWNGLQNTYPSGSLDSGIIAQDVQKVLPQLVRTNHGGYLGVRHDRLVGLLVESIKEQQEQINELKLQIKGIKNGSS